MDHPVDTVLALFTRYALSTVFLVVFLKRLGVPLPVMPVLLLAGATAAGDAVFALQALVVATLASVPADYLWFLGGRRFGRRVLALLCRISISPDTCVRRNELSFARRGHATLVLARFVPGLGPLAPPLAGALGMPVRAFLLFNGLGTMLWSGAVLTAGLVFHDQIRQLLASIADLGRLGLWLLAGGVLLYLAFRFWWRWREARALARIAHILPAELAALLQAGPAPLIVDVRAAGPGLPLLQRIPGALHIDLGSLDTATLEWRGDGSVVTYCDCPNDVSARKAAHVRARRGFDARVLGGGWSGWVAAGYALESASAPKPPAC